MTTEPRWVRVEGRNRCSDCGRFVEVAWVLYVATTVWTLSICERCVESRLAG